MWILLKLISIIGPEAKRVFDAGQRLLDKIIKEDLFEAKGIIGFYAANSVGDDIEVCIPVIYPLIQCLALH